MFETDVLDRLLGMSRDILSFIHNTKSSFDTRLEKKIRKCLKWIRVLITDLYIVLHVSQRLIAAAKIVFVGVTIFVHYRCQEVTSDKNNPGIYTVSLSITATAFINLHSKLEWRWKIYLF
jgi:hypothetical protein